jgi:hypothetical protein
MNVERIHIRPFQLHVSYRFILYRTVGYFFHSASKKDLTLETDMRINEVAFA